MMGSAPTPWDRTCQGFRRGMALAVATGVMPDWLARHVNRCGRCRQGLAYVLGRTTVALSERERGLAQKVAFVAKVRGLSRDIALLQQGHPDRRRTPGTLLQRIGGWFTRDLRASAAAAAVLALISAVLAVYLILSGPRFPPASATRTATHEPPASLPVKLAPSR